MAARNAQQGQLSALPQIQPQLPEVAAPHLVQPEQTPVAVANPQVSPMPSSVGRGSGLLGLVGAIPGSVGRAFGSADLVRDTNGNMVPKHHVLDALLNGSKATEAAQAQNWQTQQEALAQKNFIDRANALTANARGNAVVGQGIDQATRHDNTYGVSPTPGIAITLTESNSIGQGGLEAQTNKVQQKEQQNAAKELGVEGQALQDPSLLGNVTAGLNRGYNPPLINEAPLGGSSTMLDPSSGVRFENFGTGNPTTETKVINPDLMYGGTNPGGSVSRSSGGQPGASVVVPLQPDKVKAALAGNDGGVSQVNPTPVQVNLPPNFGGSSDMGQGLLPPQASLLQQLQSAQQPQYIFDPASGRTIINPATVPTVNPTPLAQ